MRSALTGKDKGSVRQIGFDLFLQSMICHYHPSMSSVGICPRCKKSVCAVCLPVQGRPCRTCIGYRWAFTSGVTGAVMVSFILGLITPLLGLGALVVLSFTFREIFRYRTRAVLRKLVTPTIQPTPIETAARRFCTNCNLWNDGPTCVQCGSKLGPQ